MDSKRVAKITTPHKDKKVKIRTGTGYPVAANLLLTARHVVEYEKKDTKKPITVCVAGSWRAGRDSAS